MDKNKKELESTVKAQKEQLSRYEARLKDVVAAYKGLLKEKEALERSLNALKTVKEAQLSETDDTPDNVSTCSDASTTDTNKVTKNINESPKRRESQADLQAQIATLMHSLTTLSAEKSRMEASFQADKKKLRSELQKKDELISRQEVKIRELEKKNSTDVETMKSKIIVERHEREKESNDHMVMIRELQKLLSDERHLKDDLEMQLNSLKLEISANGNYNLTAKLKEVTNELKEAKEKLKHYEELEENQKLNIQNSNIMQQLQQEMLHLKQQHASAIKAEQKRASLAEEHSKRLSALHEDRVANLEARLAELSNTVGTYDRLRQQDQENIQNLKDKISKLANNTSNNQPPNSIDASSASIKKRDVQTIYDEILRLKKILQVENSKSNSPIDLNLLFNSNNNDHTKCLEEYRKIKDEYESLKLENTNLTQILSTQKQNIRTLQEKVTVLNRYIEEQENELKLQNDKLVQAVKTEKSKWKNMLETAENEFRNKINELEQQLQKQRVRSLQLLDEKENEIKALKTSFELIMQPSNAEAVDSMRDPNGRRSSAAHIQTILNNQNTVTTAATAANPNLNLENCHMLHYVNEIARKDVEISTLRKSKYSAETALRQALQDKVTVQEELHDKIASLEMEVDRLERCKTREGANLEYLKNVFISFLSTSSQDGKRHMINAISTILQFTPNESEAINAILFHKKIPKIGRRLSLSK